VIAGELGRASGAPILIAGMVRTQRPEIVACSGFHRGRRSLLAIFGSRGPVAKCFEPQVNDSPSMTRWYTRYW